MAKVKIYNQAGQIIGEQELNPGIFGVNANPNLIQEVVVAMMANQRKNLANTLTRSEVRGGGKKPWKQKGTGRSRQGSIRSPIWVGGGITFGPRSNRNFSKKINKKAKRKALFMVLSDKAKSENLIILDKINIEKGKTKELTAIIKSLPLKKPSALIVNEGKDNKLINSSKNLRKIWATNVGSINFLDLLKYQNLIITKKAIESLEKIYIK